MIIGVALVVGDIRKGQRLVFRYPESVPSSVINSSDRLLKFHEEYLATSPDNFARFFCPKQPMFNKVMDIIIEDLQYISFPMPCTSESPLNNCSNDDSLRDDLSMFNVVVATVRESALKRTLNRPYSSERRKPGEDPVSELLGLSNRRLPLKKEILKSIVEKFSRALLNQEKRMGYVTQEVNLIFRIIEESDRLLSHQSSYPYSLNNNLHLNNNNNSSSSNISNNSISNNSNNNSNNNNITNNSNNHNDINRGMTRDRSGSISISNDSLSGNSVANNSLHTHQTPQSDGEAQANKRLTLCEFVLQQSSLANELRGLYHSLVGGYCVSLTVNGVLSLNIPLFSDSDENQNNNEIKENIETVESLQSPKNNNINKLSDEINDDGDLPDLIDSKKTSRKMSFPLPLSSEKNQIISDNLSNHIATKKISFHQRDSQKIYPFHTFLPVADPNELSDIMSKLGCTFNTIIESNHPPTYLPSESYNNTTNTNTNTITNTITNTNTNTPNDTSTNNININHNNFNNNNNNFNNNSIMSLKNRALAGTPIEVNYCTQLSSYSSSFNTPTIGTSVVGLTGPVSSHQCSPLVYKILSHSNPTESFAELRNILDCSMEEIYAAVKHLSLWGLGDIICPLSDESLYHLHPQTPLGNETTYDSYARKLGRKMSRTFHTIFNGSDINLILAPFNGKRALKEAIKLFPKHLQPYGIDIVIWLLRRHILQELQYYIIDPSLFPISSSEISSSTIPSSISSQSLLLPLTSENLATRNSSLLQTSLNSSISGNESYFSKTQQSFQQTDQRLERLKEHLNIYFDGKTPLCDVLWLEDTNEITFEDIFQVVHYYNLIFNIRPL